ncbi:hypothetical protein C4N9_08000 [Pararhodobacter marinus]|uniref:Uncharacterized protein n=1 Tax=Pararhodobacter marinus TaxID=2184063 RepID=A0A2U2CCQ1_9RHOB|nr:hypothetical protein [Pararhodobacter marinus]PWE29675.1 hypothetical protein C4N9_08000 [Pararhodobacter marinus]
MQLTLSPIRGLPGSATTTIAVERERLIVDGQSYDLSPVPEGGEAIADGDGHPFIAPITRRDGEIHATLRVTLGDDAAPEQPGTAWHVNATDGAVTIPATRHSSEVAQ